MQHTIPLQRFTEQIGPQAEGMVHAVEACVHCGFCLAVCPTYSVLGEEMDSPRGRIVLMKSVLEGELQAKDAMPYIDRCLGCLACVTACPSGVQYGELLMPFRAYAGEQVPARPMERLQHTLAAGALPHPRRFRLAAAAGRMARPVQRLLPAELQAMLNLLPERLPEAQPLPEFVPAEGPRRARVALLAGCVQQVLAPLINWATLRVLAKNGVDVVIPAGQGCCGALQIHTGDRAGARRMARRNLKAFPPDVDVILTNAAGCGSGMHEYPGLFTGQKDAAEIDEFSAKAQDVSVFLDALGLLPPPPLPQPVRVAYHDACHLSNAQGVTAPPRRLLAAIPGLTVAEVPDGVYCCGSAGTYNFEQPQIAAELGRRKARSILGLGVDMVAAGNIGCLTQIRSHLQAEGSSMPVLHTIELLDLAYRSTSRSQ